METVTRETFHVHVLYTIFRAKLVGSGYGPEFQVDRDFEDGKLADMWQQFIQAEIDKEEKAWRGRR